MVKREIQKGRRSIFNIERVISFATETDLFDEALLVKPNGMYSVHSVFFLATRFPLAGNSFFGWLLHVSAKNQQISTDSTGCNALNCGHGPLCAILAWRH